ncbi:MAG: type I-C CRISPR-associated endonuclease Cas1 [Kiritimatiellae bacterium]|nr:type I-C CRISPR-associated endonuclease Cas1 [Kiritimatiellia bacterium]
MKKLLNTLYVQTQGIYLRQEGETVVAEKDGQVLMRLPIHTLSGLVTFGNVMCSPFLLHLCAERGVAISFLSEHGRFLARATGPVSGNVLLRVAQVRAHDDPDRKGDIARSCVAGKIANDRNLILRRMRDHGDTPALRTAAAALADVLLRLRDSPPDAARIRGLEGEAAAAYFAAFNDLLLANREAFAIASRNRRPPTDPMNALLSFLYTLLAHDCRGALEGVGLDPQVGFLHELRSGRPSLALDLMEEFRAPVADRLALTLVNRQQLAPKDFKTTESGAVQLSESARKDVLLAWQQRKLETVTHPFLDEKVPVGLLPHLQALLLARHLRGDLDAYPPWMPK